MMSQEKKLSVALLKKTVSYVFRKECRTIQENSVASKKKIVSHIYSKSNAKGRFF
jgi:hypothetical protein